MLYLCTAGRHTYNNTGEAERCCSGFRLEDEPQLLSQKEALEKELKAAEERVAEARREISSLEDLKKKLEGDLAAAKAKRSEMLAHGKAPGADVSLAHLPSDIESISATISAKDGPFRALQNDVSGITKSLGQAKYQLARIAWHAERDAIYKCMKETLLRWNDLVKQLLAIRAAAGVEILQLGDMNVGEYPIFPQGVICGPHWADIMAPPDYHFKVLGFTPQLNFNKSGD